MSKQDVSGHLTVYLRGGAVIDLPEASAEIEMGSDGRASSIRVTSSGSVELSYLDATEVVAVVKESGRFSR